LAYDFECIFHAKPSGLDNTSVTYGGVNIFNRVENIREHITLGFLEEYHIILIDSGIEKNTKKAVTMIRAMTEDPDFGAATKSIIDAIGVTSKSIIGLIRGNPSLKGDKTGKLEEKFAQLIKYNHYLLKSVNLTNKEIDSIIK
jgi:mevalonate kinase